MSIQSNVLGPGVGASTCGLSLVVLETPETGMKSRWTQAHREAEGPLTGEPGMWLSSIPLKASSRPPPLPPQPTPIF